MTNHQISSSALLDLHENYRKANNENCQLVLKTMFNILNGLVEKAENKEQILSMFKVVKEDFKIG